LMKDCPQRGTSLLPPEQYSLLGRLFSYRPFVSFIGYVAGLATVKVKIR
jgi:hypothetical protein